MFGPLQACRILVDIWKDYGFLGLRFLFLEELKCRKLAWAKTSYKQKEEDMFAFFQILKDLF